MTINAACHGTPLPPPANVDHVPQTSTTSNGTVNAPAPTRRTVNVVSAGNVPGANTKLLVAPVRPSGVSMAAFLGVLKRSSTTALLGVSAVVRVLTVTRT